MFKPKFNFFVDLIVISLLVAWVFFSVLQFDHEVPTALILKDAEARNVTILKVMTYNIAHGRGYLSMYDKSFLGRNFNIKSKEELEDRLDKIAEMIKQQNVDIVVLQEVDFDATWSYNVDEALYIAKKAGFANVVEGIKWSVNLPFLKIRSGNAILSNFPLEGAVNKKFESEKKLRKPIGGHSFLTAKYEINGNDVVVMTSHFDSDSWKAREKEAEEVVKVVKAIDAPVIFAGDLNSVLPSVKKVNEKMREKYKDQTLKILLRDKILSVDEDLLRPNEQFTYSTENPHRLIDYIMTNDGFKITEYSVVNPKFSDHFPLLARIVFS
jgi:endonuclease/exonuclease/phosphatase family metal-dependent hydrolase